MMPYNSDNNSTDILILIAIVAILLYLYYNTLEESRAYFTGKPTASEKIIYVKQIVSNKLIFDEDLYTAKSIMPWIDAITYEDIRKLIRENNFNEETILSVLN